MLVRTFKPHEGGAVLIGDVLVVVHPVRDGKLKIGIVAHPDDKIRFFSPEDVAQEIPRLISALEAEYKVVENDDPREA